MKLSTGAVTYLVADTLGSVRGTVNSAGALTGTTSYDAWGNPETTGGLTATTPLGYAGGYTDPDGLVYLINRYYDPATGQFTSADPDVAETQQPYQYADSDPADGSDPTGLYRDLEEISQWGEHVHAFNFCLGAKFAGGSESANGEGNASGCWTYHNVTYADEIAAYARVDNVSSSQLAVTWAGTGFDVGRGWCDPDFRLIFRYNGKTELRYYLWGRDRCYHKNHGYFFGISGDGLTTPYDTKYNGPVFHDNVDMDVNMYAVGSEGERIRINPKNSYGALVLPKHGSGLENTGPL